MPDLLRVLFDAVGVRASYGAELEADHGSAWRHRFPSGPEHVWVATRFESLWVGRGDAVALLPPRKGAILAPGAERWVGTDAHVHPEPRVDQPPVGGVSLASAGTHHGTVHVGPLFDEVVRLPDLFTTTTHHDAHHDVDTDVLLALEHLGSVAAVRWPGPARDALAQLVVVSLLMTWQVPVLDDRSLTRCFDAIADAERSVRSSTSGTTQERSPGGTGSHPSARCSASWSGSSARRSASRSREQDPSSNSDESGSHTPGHGDRIRQIAERTCGCPRAGRGGVYRVRPGRRRPRGSRRGPTTGARSCHRCPGSSGRCRRARG